MFKLFYLKMALSGLQKNCRIYIPYMITCVGAVLMFYNACGLTLHSTMDGSVQEMMKMGTVVTGIFSAIFLFYTNSFLMKRRKKEFGLYHTLGMEKKHIGKIIFWESFSIDCIGLVGGIFLGMVFSKLTTLILYKLLQFDPNFQFEISLTTLGITLCLFSGIFLVILLCNLRQIYKADPAELLKSENLGEKEPKSRGLITAIGVVTLGAGYALALFTESPTMAMPIFLLAVVLVIIGTYCLFTAGSISLLKGIRKNKAYFYKTKYFIAVSGMIYRMKQNAAGLASICIMSTAVLVMISTTVSTYVGMNDLLKNRFPKDFALNIGHTPEEPLDGEGVSLKMKEILGEQSVSNYSAYNYLTFATYREGDKFETREQNKIDSSQNLTILVIMTQEDYEKVSGKKLLLSPEEAAVFSKRKMQSLSLPGREFAQIVDMGEEPLMGSRVAWAVDVVYAIVPAKEDLIAVYNAQVMSYGEWANDLTFELSFDIDLKEGEKEAFTRKTLATGIESQLSEYSFTYDSKQLSKSNFFLLYGSLLFLGMFLGFLFLMATVLIIYYKQIVEGFEDRANFIVMQKVGMSKEEIKKSVNAQISIVFALPIFMAAVHILVAFPILTKLLRLLNLTNVPLFAICLAATLLVFTLIYIAVYRLTARVYYSIVNQ